MMTQMMEYVEGVANPDLRALLDYFFTDEEFVRQFRRSPAAVRHHCNWIGGTSGAHLEGDEHLFLPHQRLPSAGPGPANHRRHTP